MRKYIKKRSIKRKMLSDPKKINILFYISTALMIILFVFFIGQKRQISVLKQNTNKLVLREKELEENISKLKLEIENSNSLEYIEKKARENLGMIKKGEKIYTDDENSINTVPKESSNEQDSSQDTKETNKETLKETKREN
ncbi:MULTISPECIES: FtsB family cell division protein [Helcococcus]|uniref:Septum formation initiator family protein n=1 Tax=Helcococcus bovis TaxID=3153252 RepID=A0ABW9F7H1_9FIRM